MLIRRETPADHAAVRAVTTAAFATPERPEPVEAPLLDALRACEDWLPALSLVAVGDRGGEEGQVVGHVACTRGRVDGAPALLLAPLGVHPGHQRRGVGLALVHSVLGAADALGEPLVALLGDPAYYGRYGFRTSTEYGIVPPEPSWGAYFQVRTLSTYREAPRGTFRLAEPFDHL
ncbi:MULTISPECIES: N-acetyltransferase [unclassified Streptomyces]|uniref:GNAT family N-acetyltransferase n=1 Tax=unclassified Streptomyces TaxID=2593676 RepID=UPI002E7808C3|nr:N-acetyltransferase [Streptomyces sp. JV176]MEE1802152.1 N-acetyltransferase [Streptomyces sp. JV176]